MRMLATELSTDQLHQLASDGFVVVDNFLDRQTTARLIDAVESLPVDETATRTKRGIAFARRNLLDLDFIRNLIADPRLRDLLDTISSGLIATRAILFDKTGSANWTVPWHQDRSIAVREKIDVPGFGPWSTKVAIIHVQPPVEILRQMITLRFHLDPCGADNGPLRVIAGMHHGILAPSEIDSAIATREQTTCCTTPGGLLIMRPLVLHASSPAKVPSHRRVIHIEFGPQSLPGGLRWATADVS
jgi:ectoine hydroxylase-related dioxygenase (phytanoyl-CoA dioxygenase family)